MMPVIYLSIQWHDFRGGLTVAMANDATCDSWRTGGFEQLVPYDGGGRTGRRNHGEQGSLCVCVLLFMVSCDHFVKGNNELLREARLSWSRGKRPSPRIQRSL